MAIQRALRSAARFDYFGVLKKGVGHYAWVVLNSYIVKSE
jgi:hypothetical protein